MFYDRKIKYVDIYENGEKVQNAGYVKLEVSGKEVVLQLQLSKLRGTDTCKCPVVLIAGTKEARLGEVTLEGGKGVWESDRLDVDNMLDDIKYPQLQEIRIKLPGERVLRCIVNEITDEEIVQEEKEDVNAELQQESLNPEELEEDVEALRRPDDNEESTLPAENHLNVQEKQPQTIGLPVQRTGMSLATAGKWQQLLTIYPHIRPFEDMREYLMIKPDDLVILPEKYFSLSGNSFLLHGYYNYEHLILTKEERNNKEMFYIGVPGNLYYKEKQVAFLFGFESFEGKTEPAGNGDFGYYMIPVEL